MRAGRHDPAERRRATRAGRRKGCYIYITGEVLERMGFEPGGELPFYRTWGAPGRGRVMVSLYKKK